MHFRHDHMLHRTGLLIKAQVRGSTTHLSQVRGHRM